ncbi:MAG TPA: pyridoxal-phosphate dependent enzyme, partial [Longimicrobiaceae bacterium]|nr:pyridoxal-phosphate dependent enzyme [Longimicrobiaceae bacterium]
MTETSIPVTLPTLDSVREAAARLQGVANHTPVLTSRTLDEQVGARVFLKCENFQRAGAFKFRGAYNAIVRLSEEERARGVLTFSSGNHAQAVALVGRLLGARTAIVMPENAPAAKLAATRGYGAEVILYAPEETTREELADRLRDERGMTVVPPYDHADVVAGQGTAALEMIEEVGPL